MKLSKESIEYCKELRKKNGCVSDYKFCEICRSNPIINKDRLNNWVNKINEYAKANNRKRRL